MIIFQILGFPFVSDYLHLITVMLGLERFPYNSFYIYNGTNLVSKQSLGLIEGEDTV